MKRFILISLAAFALTANIFAANYIRVNQMGYLPGDFKAAVMLLDKAQPEYAAANHKNYLIVNINTGKSTLADSVAITEAWEPFEMCVRIYFSSITAEGEYFIWAQGTNSPHFKVGNDVYNGANEIPLHYMRQQRCGYNPALKATCHQHDGRLVLAGKRDGKKVDVTGGWHDASDYLQYLTTSANAVYQMLFAYEMTPTVWADNYDSRGDEGANGVPDILDEARWGLEWMLKMNPEPDLFLNQIADDRDHRFAGVPADDNVDYGWSAGRERPVYPCSAQPYGLFNNKNESTGLASSVGKFCSSFAFGARLFKNIDPEFSAILADRADNAYKVAKANPGACQTAPCTQPYYYEEDNWVDDMELAAAEMWSASGDDARLKEAFDYGRQEPVTPWMGADSAYHYQWYPFINLGHFRLAHHSDEFVRNMRAGLRRVADRAGNSAFRMGIPFVWCSNNFTVAFVSQAMLYRELTGDRRFVEYETAARDWLFGVNPWGKCMIIDLPKNGDTPSDPHSPVHNVGKIPITGGLVDGPVYASIYNSLLGIHLRNADRYARFQNSRVVYHDDYADYSTNEPTMDGTASTTYLLGRLASAANKQSK